MSTQELKELTSRRNTEIEVGTAIYLITTGTIGVLALAYESIFLDGMFIGSMIGGAILIIFWYIACSLLFGITLHWHAKERTFRSQIES